MRSSELTKRPVVTMAGEDVAQLKDVVYDGSGGSVGGFTLAGRGLFAGPMKKALSWQHVRALGRDAVMVDSEDVFAEPETVVERSDARERDVLGSHVITDTGTDLGSVVDVILQVGDVADVAGYEIESSPAMDRDGRRVLIPLPDTMAVSGQALIVPASATEFVADDLAGFGASVDAFREHLRGGR